EIDYAIHPRTKVRSSTQPLHRLSEQDFWLETLKPLLFKVTEHDPQIAHELFVHLSRGVYHLGLEDFLLNNPTNTKYVPFELSNAAGFNKNGDIPPTVLFYLGFDRVIIGTVTMDPWLGNPRPTIRRYSPSESMINWMGLPGEGVEIVAENLAAYGEHPVPLTINIMSTPQKKSDDVLRDLEKTVLTMRNVHSVDRFELNISCPNTHSTTGELDAREQYQQQLEEMLVVVEENMNPHQKLYLKVSPNLTLSEIKETVAIAKKHRVHGITATNTSTVHDRHYIPFSPMKEGKQIGGASGNAVYSRSLETQKKFARMAAEADVQWEFIACGGINSLERVKERATAGAKGIQIYTPLIFSGPKMVRMLRQYQA
ncbi:hypothetical protein J4421_01255, partial [Candidatus Woesearchaeota archaeon]|nr:hypothetical protein [Candidatus Woesearchaeota archaeon]